jgi:hypothetical protein
VAGVDAAELRGNSREGDQLVGLRIAAWRVIRSAREADRPGLHPCARERDHPRELRGIRRAVGHAEHLAADGAVRHEDRRVRTDAALFVVGALCGYVHRSAAVRVEDRGGDALCENRLAVIEFAGEPFARVRVHVDEPGSDVASRRVDDNACLCRPEGSNRSDACAANGNVSGDRGSAGAIDHLPAANEDVVRSIVLCGDARRRHAGETRERCRDQGPRPRRHHCTVAV